MQKIFEKAQQKNPSASDEKQNDDYFNDDDNPYSAEAIQTKLNSIDNPKHLDAIDEYTYAYANGSLGDEAYFYKGMANNLIIAPVNNLIIKPVKGFVKCGSEVLKGLDYVMKNPKATVKEVSEFLKASKEIVKTLGGGNTIKLAQEIIQVSSQETAKIVKDGIKNYPKNFKNEFQNADRKRRLEMGGEVFANALIAAGIIKNVAKASSKGMRAAIKEQAKKRFIIAKNGVKVERFTKHGIHRAIGDFKRVGVKPEGILDALKKPLKICDIKTNNKGLRSQRFIGRFGEVVVNPDTGGIVSVNPIDSAKLTRLLRNTKK